MKTVFGSFFLAFFLMGCSINNQADKTKYDYPGLGLIIEAYYEDYYHYPATINDLVSFINMNKFPENFDATIKKFKGNKDKMILKNENNSFKIILEDSVIYAIEQRSPCDELSYNSGAFSGRILFFDTLGISIYSVHLTNQFKSDIKEIKRRYDKVVKDGANIKFLMLNFARKTGLTLFCDDNIQLQEYEYFQEVEKYLFVFTNKNQIDRIVFSTPIFFREVSP